MISVRGHFPPYLFSSRDEFRTAADHAVSAMGVIPDIPDLNEGQTAGATLSAELEAAITFLIDPRGQRRLPDLIWTSELQLFVVRTEVRNWLGEHQPGELQFCSVPVRSTQPIAGNTEHRGYFLMGMIPEVDPFDVERMVLSGGMYGFTDGRTLRSAYDAPCVVIAEKLVGFHFWRTGHRQGKQFMCSNEFWAFYRSNRFRGLEKRKVCAEE